MVHLHWLMTTVTEIIPPRSEVKSFEKVLLISSNVNRILDRIRIISHDFKSQSIRRKTVRKCTYQLSLY
jgi:hypothetical protein